MSSQVAQSLAFVFVELLSGEQDSSTIIPRACRWIPLPTVCCTVQALVQSSRHTPPPSSASKNACSCSTPEEPCLPSEPTLYNGPRPASLSQHLMLLLLDRELGNMDNSTSASQHSATAFGTSEAGAGGGGQLAAPGSIVLSRRLPSRVPYLSVSLRASGMTFLRVWRHSIRRKGKTYVQCAPPHGSPGMDVLSMGGESRPTSDNKRSWGHGNLPMAAVGWRNIQAYHPPSLPPSHPIWLSHHPLPQLLLRENCLANPTEGLLANRRDHRIFPANVEGCRRTEDPTTQYVLDQRSAPELSRRQARMDGKRIYRIGLVASTICRGCPPTTPPPPLWL